MNKLYQNFKIDNYDNATGVYVQPCKIISAKIVPGVLDGAFDALHIDLVSHENKSSRPFGYGLIGGNVFGEFMKDLNVDALRPEGLVGKVVNVHVPKDSNCVRGISLQK